MTMTIMVMISGNCPQDVACVFDMPTDQISHTTDINRKSYPQESLEITEFSE